MVFEEGKRMLETVIEPGLRNEGKIRQQFNLVYFQKLIEHIPKWPWAFKVRRQYFGLLGEEK